LKTIGRKEVVNLPALGLRGINAKIDTGAYTSSIHCDKIKKSERGISCQFHNPNNKEIIYQHVTFKEFSKRTVKSSNGVEEERFAVWTEIIIGGESFPIELTLTSRIEMKSPLLIGRKFLKKKYLVDVSKKNILFK
jgi:hypothetical protein